MRVKESRLLMRRHTAGHAGNTSQNIHHLIRVTLKDGTAWAIDPAGAQYGQLKAILPFFEYDHHYVAKILARRPYGANEKYPEKFIQERHPQDKLLLFRVFAQNRILEYVVDELAEWKFKHVTVETVVKSAEVEYQRLKLMLLEHLKTSARECVKWSSGDTTSSARPILAHDTTGEDLPEEEKMRIKRKHMRRLASMDPKTREWVESEEAKGTQVVLL